MPAGSGPIRKMLFTQDLSFVGYTYRNFAAVKGKRHSIEKGSVSPRSSVDSTHSNKTFFSFDNYFYVYSVMGLKPTSFVLGDSVINYST